VKFKTAYGTEIHILSFKLRIRNNIVTEINRRVPFHQLGKPVAKQSKLVSVYAMKAYGDRRYNSAHS